jgi:tagatose-1,6-bisphosphate aldolase
MGLLDRAKQQAQDLTRKVEGKVDDVQNKRRVNDLLEQLGRLAYAEQTGRPAPDADAAGAKVIEELRTFESEGVDVLAAPPPGTDPPGA